MRTVKLDKKSFSERNNRLEYSGPKDVVSGAKISIEIEAGLGRVFFAALNVCGHILAHAGTSIEVGESIIAGGSIKVDGSITASRTITVGGSVLAGLSVQATSISCQRRIFAGLCTWRTLSEEEAQIRAEIESGTVVLGTVVTPKKVDINEPA